MRVMQLQKRLMAIAGVFMLVYLVWHMVTMLTFFSEPTFSAFYAWYNASIVRYLVTIAFLVILVLHVRTALKIRHINAKARVVDYHRHTGFKIPAKLVTASILFLLAFVLIHIIQSLWFDADAPYQALVALFQSFFMLAFYLAGLFVLTMHLQHSLANVLQTLGKTAFSCHTLAWSVTIALTGGLAVVPISIYIGLI